MKLFKPAKDKWFAPMCLTVSSLFGVFNKSNSTGYKTAWMILLFLGLFFLVAGIISQVKYDKQNAVKDVLDDDG